MGSRKSRLIRHGGRAHQGSRAPIESLERRVLFSVNPAEDFGSGNAGQFAHLAPTTCSCPGCSVPSPAAIAAKADSPVMPAQFPLADTFKLHSLASATKRIYLDFNGHTTNDPAWNKGVAFTTPAYSIDGTPAFSDTELQNIQEIWTRVSEDFSPFEVDVTTEEPSLQDLMNTGGGDVRWGVRVVIGANVADLAGRPVGGIAILNSFDFNADRPCFVFPEALGNVTKNIAECSSHEVGHTLGLSHDGRSNPAEEYYQGQGSWAPIMGDSYSRVMSQWSKGEYRNANNAEDDLAVITADNGFGYRQDDYGNDLASAKVMSSDQIQGIIEQNTDVDVFGFVVAGSIQASIKPIMVGANLDVSAEILDAKGSVVATSNPLGAIDASFSLTVAPGKYYLRVQGTGEGDPLQTGYSRYGSLGQYTVTVANVATEPLVVVSDADVTEGNAGETTATFTLQLLTAGVTPVTVSFATHDGSATEADADYVPSAGSVVFAPGELTKSIAVQVRGDTWREHDETFSVVISEVRGGVVGKAFGTGTIRNDDERVGVTLLPAVVVETTGSQRSVLEYTAMIRGISDETFVLAFETRNGTALAGSDYRPNSGQILVRPGQTEKQIAVSVVGDGQPERDETVFLAVAAVGTDNVDVFGPLDDGRIRQAAGVAPGIILDDDSRFFTIRAVNATVAAGSPFQFQVGLSRRAGYGEALPSFAEFGSLPSGFLEMMAGQIRFTASYMSGHTPTAGAPRRPRMGTPDVREGTISLGYTASESGGIATKATDTFEIQTDAVARRRPLAVQLFNPTNAMLDRLVVARTTVTPSSAAAFAALASAMPALTSRRR